MIRARAIPVFPTRGEWLVTLQRGLFVGMVAAFFLGIHLVLLGFGALLLVYASVVADTSGSPSCWSRLGCYQVSLPSARLGFRFPCDGPGRGGTWDVQRRICGGLPLHMFPGELIDVVLLAYVGGFFMCGN